MPLSQGSRAWIKVAPQDYEAHMSAIGQAQANAALVEGMVEGMVKSAAIPQSSRILIAGAGTGQMFDYIDAAIFSACRLVCSDINAAFLARLRERVACETMIDDVEDSRLQPGFAAIILVLVLEHVDVRKALSSMARLDPQRLMIVIQENPPAMPTAVTPGRELTGTMRILAQEAPPRLAPFSDLQDALRVLGFHLEHRREASVADGKKMIGAVFRKMNGSVTS